MICLDFEKWCRVEFAVATFTISSHNLITGACTWKMGGKFSLIIQDNGKIKNSNMRCIILIARTHNSNSKILLTSHILAQPEKKKGGEHKAKAMARQHPPWGVQMSESHLSTWNNALLVSSTSLIGCGKHQLLQQCLSAWKHHWSVKQHCRQ